tara:strand:+ start:479 stop:655 length:177 start_codon:yes stop_codon:yes gene_type:complete
LNNIKKEVIDMAIFFMALLLVVVLTNIEGLFNIFIVGLLFFIVGSAIISAYNWVLSFA